MKKVRSVSINYVVILALSVMFFLLTHAYSSYAITVNYDIHNKNQFIENKGQFIDGNGSPASDIKFVANDGLKSIYVRKSGISFVNLKYTADTNIFDAEIQEMNFTNCNQDIEISGYEKSSDYINYYLTHCPDGILNVYKFARIEYKNIYENIDFQLYINESGELQYDFIINPGGDPDDIQLHMKNIVNLNFDGSGLIVKSIDHEIIHTPPFSYQIIDDQTTVINSSFRIIAKNSIGFNVGKYDKTKKLVIDPVIRQWGTFFGGIFEDELRSVSYDSNNNIISCGFSSSNFDISTSSAYQKDLNGIADAIIIKLDNNGNRLWSTYYGGSELDMGADVAIDQNDNIILSGSTLSNDVLGNGGYQINNNGSFDCFLAKFNPSGYRVWGTFYGGGQDDNPYVPDAVSYGKIVLDDNANIYLSGITISENIIGEGGWQPNIDPSKLYDCFLAKFDPNGNRIWGTYYGGNSNDWLTDIDIDHEGNLILGGATQSTYRFASEGAWQIFELAYGIPSFLSKFDSENGNRIWGTYFFEEEYVTHINDISTDNNGNIYFVAQTDAENLGIGKYKNEYTGEMDFLIGKFSNDGKPVWTSYIGGSKWDYSTDIHAGKKGELYVCGISESSDFPVRSAYQNQLNGFRDIVLMKYDTSGRYLWGTFYGGFSSLEDLTNDIGWSFDINDNDQIVMAGRTSSVEVFGFGGFQDYYGGGEVDSWIGLFDEHIITCGEPNPASVCPESEITIPFYLDKNLEENIQIDAFLWKEDGEYFDEVVIGTTTTNLSGTLDATIPNSIAPGNYYVSLKGAENFFPVLINPLPIPEIIGTEYVCSKHDQTYNCNLQDGYTFKWESKYGIINGRDDQKNVVVNWNESGSDTLKLTVTNDITGCSGYTSKEIKIDIWDTKIYGKTLVCFGESQQTYYNNIFGLQKRWAVSGGKILSGQNTDTITVKWNTTGINQVELSLTNPNGGCSDTTSINVTVDEYQIPDPTIFGRLAVCPDELQEYFVVSNGVNSYEWHVVGGEIVENEPKNKIFVKWAGEAVAGISVIERTPAGCSGSDDRKIYINCLGAEIFGIDKVCVGGVYQYFTQSIIGTSNLWTAKPGGEVLFGRLLDTVSVLWSQADTKIIGLTKVTETQYGNCTKIITKMINNSYEISVFDIPEIEYDPKDQYEKTISIPITIEKPGCLRYVSEETTVTAKVRLKKSMFLPLTNSTQSYEDDENDIWRTITVQQPAFNTEEGSILFEITGYALLGDTLGTPISIQSIEWSGIVMNYLAKNGSLKLKNITGIGGKRLLKKLRMQFLNIYPVPFSDELNLLIECREKADVWIELYSVLGEKVFSENFILSEGVQDKKIKLSDRLSDGVYRIVLRNNDIIISENVVIKN